MNPYKMCKMLCPICQNEWDEEIEMLGTGETAIVRCPECETIVDGLIERVYDEEKAG